ncbi:hypothetical protein [Paraburkholderia sp. UCT31]|uniref:hypothetical protein n=1 Tax=Paraburkholderia sp. UCT31 TaxID=2615209 RepID=UPI001655C119|nr:hypothetical protein [Paraburkholderia sp. UCT31]
MSNSKMTAPAPIVELPNGMHVMVVRRHRPPVTPAFALPGGHMGSDVLMSLVDRPTQTE